MTEVRRISRKELKQGLLYLIIIFPCLILHGYLWWLWSITFMPLILPLTLIIISSCISARLLRKSLSRLWNSGNMLLHTVTMVLLLSWIPLGALIETNYRFADGIVRVETLPVADRGVELTSRGNSSANWVKVKRGWYSKSLYVHDKRIPLDKIDSVRFRLSSGYFGFDVMLDRAPEQFVWH